MSAMQCSKFSNVEENFDSLPRSSNTYSYMSSVQKWLCGGLGTEPCEISNDKRLTSDKTSQI